eukprot:5778027-Prymnesium_polylepis.1
MPPPSLGAVQLPSFRRGSSTLDINESDFEWLKGYLVREHSKRQSDVLALAIPEEPPEEPPVASRKSKTLHDEPAAAPPPPPKLGRWGASLVLDEDHDHEDESGTTSEKQKRRKIGWTNTEDLAILAAVRRVGTQWPRIAAHLPGRTADAVSTLTVKRPPAVLKNRRWPWPP